MTINSDQMQTLNLQNVSEPGSDVQFTSVDNTGQFY